MKLKIEILIVFLLFCSNATAQNWPFRDANGNVVRGIVTGTPGDYRSANPPNYPANYNGSRFH